MWSILVTHLMIVPHSSRITVVTKPLGSHSHHQNNPSPKKIFGKIFRQPLLQHVDTPPGSSEAKLPAGAKISGIRFLTRLHTQAHTMPLPARDSFFGHRTSPPESPTVDLLVYIPGFLIQHLHLHFFLCFVSDSCTFLGFLDFSDTQ